VRCHENLPGRLGQIVNLEWHDSVHYENEVTCDGCHGGDASVTTEQYPTFDGLKQAAHLWRNPEFSLLHDTSQGFVSRARGRSVSYFCGRCHTLIMEKHLGSPHGNFGDPSCLYCHGQGSHAIQPAAVDIIDTRSAAQGGRCALCHEAGTMQTVSSIKETLTEAAARIDSSAEQYRVLEEQMGYKNLSLEAMHHHKEETHSRLRQVFHSFNLREIGELTSSIEAVANQTDYAVDLVASLRSAQQRQTIVGLTSVVFLFAFAGLLVYYKHAFCEGYDKSDATPPNEDVGV
jgi:hypothetical protein